MLVPCLQCKNPVFVSASALSAGAVQAKCTSCRSALVVEKGGAVRLAGPVSPTQAALAPAAVEVPAPLAAMPEYAPEMQLPEIPAEPVVPPAAAAPELAVAPVLPEFSPELMVAPAPVLIADPEPERVSLPRPALIVPPPGAAEPPGEPIVFAAPAVDAAPAAYAAPAPPLESAPPMFAPVESAAIVHAAEAAPLPEPTPPETASAAMAPPFVASDLPSEHFAAAPALSGEPPSASPPPLPIARQPLTQDPEPVVLTRIKPESPGPLLVSEDPSFRRRALLEAQDQAGGAEAAYEATPASSTADQEAWRVRVSADALVLQYLGHPAAEGAELPASTVELSQTSTTGAEAWSVSSGVHRLTDIVASGASVSSAPAASAAKPDPRVVPPRRSGVTYVFGGLAAAALVVFAFVAAFSSARRSKSEAGGGAVVAAPAAAAPSATPQPAPTEVTQRPGELASAQLGEATNDVPQIAGAPPAAAPGLQGEPLAMGEPEVELEFVAPTNEAKARPSTRDVVACYQRGNRLLNQKKVALAIRELNRCVELDPTFGKAYRSLGVAHMLLGREKTAIQAYEKFVEHDPQHKDVAKVREIIADYHRRRGL